MYALGEAAPQLKCVHEVVKCDYADVRPFAKVAAREHTCVKDAAGKEWFCIRHNGGMVVAFYGLTLSKSNARFSSNYTHPDFRRRGCLAAFIEHAKAYAAERGCEKLTAFASAMSAPSHLRHGAVADGQVNGATFVVYDLRKPKEK